MSRTLAFLAATLFAMAAPVSSDPMRPDPNMPRPMAAVDTVFIEDMTWLEVRDAMRAGKTTVIVPTGGVEMNGPYLVAGKHNVVLRVMADSIARALGDALVAPIVPFVPEGDIDPPTGHMLFPSTISVTEDTYERLLTDICSSFRTHGFKNIILLGDSGGNQRGMKEVAADLSARWKGGKSRVYDIPEYYDYGAVTTFLESQGVKQVAEGHHDDFAITAIMMAADPTTVRMNQRIAAGNFRINGIELAPAAKTVEWGRKIIAFRTKLTVAAIRKATASRTE